MLVVENAFRASIYETVVVVLNYRFRFVVAAVDPRNYCFCFEVGDALLDEFVSKIRGYLYLFV